MATSRRRRTPSRSTATPRSVSRTVKHAEAQAGVYAGPWFVFGLAPIVGQVLHLLGRGQGGWTALVIMMIVVAAAGLGVAGYVSNRDRSPVALWHTLVTVGAGAAWFVLCTVAGVFELRPVEGTESLRLPMPYTFVLTVWFILGGALAVAWNMRQGITAAEIRTAEAKAAIHEELDPWTEAGHPGVKGTLRRVNAYRQEGTLTLPPGDTLDDLVKDRKRIETAHDWPDSSISFTHDRRWNNSRKVWAVLMTADPLVVSPIWPGVQLKRGQSIFDPIPKGVRADGELATILIATKTGGKHRLVAGMTGAGKTVGEKPILLYAAALGVDIILIDVVKQTQSYGSMAGIFQMFEIEKARAYAIIRRLITHTVPDRTRHLAREGLTEWDPKRSSLKFLCVHIEEAYSVCDEDEITALAVALRSAGGQLTISLQRPTYDQMPVTLRAQLGTRCCYGLMEPEDASYALADDVLDAVAVNPAVWRDTQPGMQYVQQGGLTLAEQAMSIRSFTDEGAAESFADAARRIAITLSPMCSVTAHSLGVLWDSRIPPADLMARHGPAGPAPTAARRPTSPPPAAPPATGQVIARRDDPDDDTLEAELVMTMNEDGTTVTFLDEDGGSETMRLDEPDPDPEHPPNPDDDIEDQPTDRAPVQFGNPVTRVTQVEFDAAMRRRLDELCADPARELVKASDFTDVIIGSGWTRTNVYNRLACYVDESLLVRTDDGWAPVRTGVSA